MSNSWDDFLQKCEVTRKNKLSIVPSDDTYDVENDIFTSKLGGIPYWPKGKDYPRLGGIEAKLMVQLNLDEMLKKVDIKKVYPCYPSTGILQFFLLDDPLLGLGNGGESTRVIYHPDTSVDHFLTEEQFLMNLNNGEFPYAASLKLDFNEADEILEFGDKTHTEFKELYDEYDKLISEGNEFHDSNSGSKIGGYAYFTQYDPFEGREIPDEMVVLLQLDSNSDLDLLIGDSGVASWRLEKTKLQNLDFSMVHYTWDCC